MFEKLEFSFLWTRLFPDFEKYFRNVRFNCALPPATHVTRTANILILLSTRGSVALCSFFERGSSCEDMRLWLFHSGLYNFLSSGGGVRVCTSYAHLEWSPAYMSEIATDTFEFQYCTSCLWNDLTDQPSDALETSDTLMWHRM